MCDSNVQKGVFGEVQMNKKEKSAGICWRQEREHSPWGQSTGCPGNLELAFGGLPFKN